MLLTADVGNTNIKLGIFDGEKLRYKLRFSTNEKMTSDEFAHGISLWFVMKRLPMWKCCQNPIPIANNRAECPIPIGIGN